MKETVEYGKRLPASWVGAAVELYDAAFASKMALAVANAADRKELIRLTVNPDHALTAAVDGRLLGLVALNSTHGSFTEDIGWYASNATTLGPPYKLPLVIC